MIITTIHDPTKTLKKIELPHFRAGGLLKLRKSCSEAFVYIISMLQDLVKSHLMSAVRSEVEELRDKISKLEVQSFIFFLDFN